MLHDLKFSYRFLIVDIQACTQIYASREYRRSNKSTLVMIGESCSLVCGWPYLSRANLFVYSCVAGAVMVRVAKEATISNVLIHP